MTAESASDFAALEAQAQALMATFTNEGYELVAPAILQPARLFLDVVGEQLRARTYIFTDPTGAELCLRPDLTVPTCRLHLERQSEPQAAAIPARYCYNGSAFRVQPGGATRTHPREFRQAGIEAFGGRDAEQADAETIALTARALRASGLTTFRVRLGDLGLLAAMIDALGVPERWRQRLRHTFPHPEAFRAELHRLGDAGLRRRELPEELLRAFALAGPDDDARRRAVETQLVASGVDLVGSRSADEIADGLADQIADCDTPSLAPAKIALIESYLAVSGPPREAARRIKDIARATGHDIADRLARFVRRLDLIEAQGLDLGGAEFSAEFGRNLAYYTGFVFEIVAPEVGPQSPVAGGGRYDALLRAVGAPSDIAAVGAAIHTERLLAVRAGRH